jgi:single-strand DNA-binding protein
MNKITATGRIAADAEVRFTPSGDAIANFRVASDVGFGDKKTTNWFACSIFGKRGESLAPHLVKGTQVTIFGMLTLREWKNSDGVKQISPDVRIDEIELQGGKKDSNGHGDNAPPPRQKSGREQPNSRNGAAFEDEIPFANPYRGKYSYLI